MTPASPRPSQSGTTTGRDSQPSQSVRFSSGTRGGDAGGAGDGTASADVCIDVGRSAVDIDGDDGSESTTRVTGARTVMALESATPLKPIIAGVDVENVPAKASIILTPSNSARNASSASVPPLPPRRALELDADMGTDRR